MKPLSLFSQFSDWDWYRPVKTRLFFILRHCKSSTLLFRSWMSAVIGVLIWPDSVTGCITGWTTGFSSSFLILVSWWIKFLVLCLIWESAWSNKLLTPWQLFSHSVSLLRKLVTLSSRDLTLAETARKSAYMSSKRFPIFFAICIILLSIFVTISRIKLSTELSLDASKIFLLSSMSFDVCPVTSLQGFWLVKKTGEQLKYTTNSWFYYVCPKSNFLLHCCEQFSTVSFCPGV